VDEHCVRLMRSRTRGERQAGLRSVPPQLGGADAVRLLWGFGIRPAYSLLYGKVPHNH
jgi:hypothetical protein